VKDKKMGDIRKKYDAALKARIALEAVKGVFGNMNLQHSGS